MSSINLGPYDANKPTLDEKANIRQSLGLSSAALLSASFADNGNTLTIADPNAPTNTITFDKASLVNNIADSLAISQLFSVSGDVNTPIPIGFNGTAPVNISVAINNSAITTLKIADGAVTTTKIANGTIIPNKLSVGGPVWDTTTFSTTTNSTNISSGVSGPAALKVGHARGGAGSSSIDLVTDTLTGSDGNAKIVRGADVNGELSISNTGTGDFKITQTGNAPIIFSTTSAERVRIGNNGRMTVEAPTSEIATLYLKTSAVGTAGSPALFVDPPGGVTSQRAAATFGDWQIGQDSVVNGTKDFYVWQGGSTNTQRVNIGVSGNVGLGKVAGTGIKLDVDGTVKATQLSGPVDDLSITTGKLANSAVTPTKLSQPITLGTAVALTNQTSIDFTSIPSWVKRITVVFDGTKSNSVAHHLIQLGISSGIVNSGYVSYTVYSQGGGANAGTNSTAGFIHWSNSANDTKYATMTLINISGNIWVSSHHGAFQNGVNIFAINGGGRIGLSEKLTTIRFTTVGGTAILNGGNVNILFE